MVVGVGRTRLVRYETGSLDHYAASGPTVAPDRLVRLSTCRVQVLRYTVVRQPPTTGSARPRVCACHDFAAVEACRVMSNPDVAASTEVRERNVFHRSAPPPVRKGAGVDDA